MEVVVVGGGWTLRVAELLHLGGLAQWQIDSGDGAGESRRVRKVRSAGGGSSRLGLEAPHGSRFVIRVGTGQLRW